MHKGKMKEIVEVLPSEKVVEREEKKLEKKNRLVTPVDKHLNPKI